MAGNDYFLLCRFGWQPFIVDIAADMLNFQCQFWHEDFIILHNSPLSYRQNVCNCVTTYCAGDTDELRHNWGTCV